jgi:hypothetical protein
LAFSATQEFAEQKKPVAQSLVVLHIVPQVVPLHL